MLAHELETLIKIFGEDEGRARFHERQNRRINAIKTEYAKLKLHVRNGEKFFLDSLPIACRNLNNPQ